MFTGLRGGFGANFLGAGPIVSKKRRIRDETMRRTSLIHGAVFPHFKGCEQEISELLGGLGVDSANMTQTGHECCRPANGSAGDDYEQRTH